jgi:RHS repeat-associated protein
VVSSYGYSYDSASNVTAYTQTLPTVSGQANPDSGSWAYTYNQREELATAKLGANPTLTYAYNDSGDRTSVQVGTGTPTTTGYDGADRVSAVGSTSYTWDAADELTTVGANRSYAYDAWGRTSSATVGATTVTYAFDALDRTLTRTPSSGSATAYAYTGLGQSIASATTGTSQPILLAYRQEGPMAQKQGSTTRAYEQNPHGDLSVITDTAGTATGTISYDPWGTVDGAIGTDAQQSLLGYQSQPTDPTTGLTDMGTRLYDPAMGRFTERDVVFGTPTNPLTLNQYAYGADSPLVYTDPTGMLIQCSGCTDTEKQLAKEQTASGVAAAEGDSSAHNYWAAQAASDYQYYIQYSGGAIDFPTPAPKPPKTDVKKPQSLQSSAMGAAGKIFGAIGDLWHGAVGTDSAYGASEFEGGGLPLGGGGAGGGTYAGGGGAFEAEGENLFARTMGGAEPVRIGQAGEAAVREAYDIGAKETVQINGRTRILDGLNDEAVSEVKNVARQSLTQQLRDQIDYATQKGRRFDLYVRPDTELSTPLFRVWLTGQVNLMYIP